MDSYNRDSSPQSQAESGSSIPSGMTSTRVGSGPDPARSAPGTPARQLQIHSLSDLIAIFLLKFSIGAFNNGRPDRSVKWAKWALALKPGPSLESMAKQMAGVGFASQNRLEDAEQRRQEAYRVALESGDQ